MDSLYSCTYENCLKAFKKRARLEIHLRTHTGERPFVCCIPGCERSYARAQHLSRHIQNVHSFKSKLQQRVACPHCQQELANSFCLKNHIRSFHSSNTQSKVYKCSYEGCDVVFHKKQQLVKHRLQHDDHLITATRCYSCPHEGCERQFVFPGKLKRHMKVHKGYPCDIDGCDEVLANWSSLRKHKATVHCPTFKCNTCGTVFKAKSNLTQHLRMHASDVQPILCTWEGCDRTFLYKKNLKQHIRSFHKGEQVFKKKSKPKPRKPRKKISAAATLFKLDDRGRKSGADSNVQKEEHLSTSSTLSLTGDELDVFLASLPCDDTSANMDSVEKNQCEDLCKKPIDSLSLNSSSYAIVSVLPCTTPS